MDIFRQKLHHIFLVPKTKFEKYFINVKQMSVESADDNFKEIYMTEYVCFEIRCTRTLIYEGRGKSSEPSGIIALLRESFLLIYDYLHVKPQIK